MVHLLKMLFFHGYVSHNQMVPIKWIRVQIRAGNLYCSPSPPHFVAEIWRWIKMVLFSTSPPRKTRRYRRYPAPLCWPSFQIVDADSARWARCAPAVNKNGEILPKYRGKSWKTVENRGKSWKTVENRGKPWKIVENHGKSWKTMENKWFSSKKSWKTDYLMVKSTGSSSCFIIFPSWNRWWCWRGYRPFFGHGHVLHDQLGKFGMSNQHFRRLHE